MSKKKSVIARQSREYDQTALDNLADSLQRYIEYVDNYVIRENTEEKKYKKALKTIRKTIKKLRKGDGDAVFNQESESFEEMMGQLYAS